MRLQKFFDKIGMRMDNVLDSFPFNRHDSKSNAEKEIDAIMEREAEEKSRE